MYIYIYIYSSLTSSLTLSPPADRRDRVQSKTVASLSAAESRRRPRQRGRRSLAKRCFLMTGLGRRAGQALDRIVLNGFFTARLARTNQPIAEPWRGTETTDGRTDEPTDGRTDERTDGRTDERTNGRTDLLRRRRDRGPNGRDRGPNVCLLDEFATEERSKHVESLSSWSAADPPRWRTSEKIYACTESEAERYGKLDQSLRMPSTSRDRRRQASARCPSFR